MAGGLLRLEGDNQLTVTNVYVYKKERFCVYFYDVATNADFDSESQLTVKALLYAMYVHEIECWLAALSATATLSTYGK